MITREENILSVHGGHDYLQSRFKTSLFKLLEFINEFIKLLDIRSIHKITYVSINSKKQSENKHKKMTCFSIKTTKCIAINLVTEVHNVLSLPGLFSSPRLMSLALFMESIHFIIGLPLFLLSSMFSSIIVFPREPCLLMMS